MFIDKCLDDSERKTGPIPTPHIRAGKEEIAPVVLMPGDPLRARFIAESFLDNPVCVNTIRNMLCFTGECNGKPITVMGSGMGMPSMGIYSYELYKFYDVNRIIRIGSAGAVGEGRTIGDVIVGMGACTDSNYGAQFGLPGAFAPIASFNLCQEAKATGERLGIPMHVGNILSSDVFYSDDAEALLKWRKMGVLAVEMEAAALYMNAARAGKEALCLVTVSDCPLTGESMNAKQRETSFLDMIQVALDIIFK